MYSTLLIDFDGVLRRWPKEYAALEARTQLPAGAIMQVAFERSRLEKVVTGKITDETWRKEVANDLMQRYPESLAFNAIQAWSKSVGEVNLEVLKLTQEARAKCQVVLITNGTDRLQQDLSKLGLVQSFDAIVNSSEIGFAKPSAEIFQHALAVAGAVPKSAVFVDDTQSHIEGARRLGINCHHYQAAAGLAQFLAQHGLRDAASQETPSIETYLNHDNRFAPRAFSDHWVDWRMRSWREWTKPHASEYAQGG